MPFSLNHDAREERVQQGGKYPDRAKPAFNEDARGRRGQDPSLMHCIISLRQHSTVHFLIILDRERERERAVGGL